MNACPSSASGLPDEAHENCNYDLSCSVGVFLGSGQLSWWRLHFRMHALCLGISVSPSQDLLHGHPGACRWVFGCSAERKDPGHLEAATVQRTGSRQHSLSVQAHKPISVWNLNIRQQYTETTCQRLRLEQTVWARTCLSEQHLPVPGFGLAAGRNCCLVLQLRKEHAG